MNILINVFFCCSISVVVDMVFLAKEIFIYMREDLAKLGGGGRVFMSNSSQTIFFCTKQIADVPRRPVVPTVGAEFPCSAVQQKI